MGFVLKKNPEPMRPYHGQPSHFHVPYCDACGSVNVKVYKGGDAPENVNFIQFLVKLGGLLLALVVIVGVFVMPFIFGPILLVYLVVNKNHPKAVCSSCKRKWNFLTGKAQPAQFTYTMDTFPWERTDWTQYDMSEPQGDRLKWG